MIRSPSEQEKTSMKGQNKTHKKNLKELFFKTLIPISLQVLLSFLSKKKLHAYNKNLKETIE